MNFYDRLAQPEPECHGPTEEERLEAEIDRLMETEEIQKAAKELYWEVRRACLAAKDRGERRIFGGLEVFREEGSDRDGYSLPVHYQANFIPWEGGNPQYQIDCSYAPWKNQTFFSLDSLPERQALLVLVNELLLDDGFPFGCVLPFNQVVVYHVAEGMPKGWSDNYYPGMVIKTCDSYILQANISW